MAIMYFTNQHPFILSLSKDAHYGAFEGVSLNPFVSAIV